MSMKSQTPTPGKSGGSMRVTYILLIVVAITAAGAFGYSIYAESRAQAALLPHLKLQSLVRDIRKYQKLAGRVPKTFDEIEALVWKHKTSKPTFDMNGAAYTLGNYLYVLHATDDRTATVWAVPLGPRKDEASAHFVVIGPDGFAHWKGAAFAPEDARGFPANPSLGTLASLGLTRQPDEVDTKRKRKDPTPASPRAGR